MLRFAWKTKIYNWLNKEGPTISQTHKVKCWFYMAYRESQLKVEKTTQMWSNNDQYGFEVLPYWVSEGKCEEKDWPCGPANKGYKTSSPVKKLNIWHID